MVSPVELTNAVFIDKQPFVIQSGFYNSWGMYKPCETTFNLFLKLNRKL